MSSKKLNLAECRQECFDCIKAYKQKHSLVKGDKFSIPCTGIPSEYITDEVLAGLGEDTEIAICSQDPVEWAKHFLDWHCLDPKGEIWARKTQEGTLGELPLYNHAQAQAGKSIFHRPYQSTMLSCSSRRKVFRLGRQSGKTEVLCIAMLFHLWNHENFKIIVIAPYQSQIDLIFTRVTNLLRSNTILSNSIERSVKAPNYQIKLKNGSQVSGFSCVAGTKIITKNGYKNIEDILVGDDVLCLDPITNTLTHQIVTEVFLPNFKEVFQVILNNGYEVVVSEDHPFWTLPTNTKRKKACWKKLKDFRGQRDIRVACVNDYKYEQKYQIDPLGYLFGLILGDGNITEATLRDGGARFTNSNPVICKSFEKTLTDLSIQWRKQIHSITGSNKYTIYKRASRFGKEYNAFTKLLYKYNLVGLTSHTKYIPEELLKIDNPSFRYSLLYGLLETDGWLESGGAVGIGSISKKLAYQYSRLLLSFGIKNRIRRKKQAGKKAWLKQPLGKQRYICSKYDMFEVMVSGKGYVRKLLDIFNLQHKEKYDECIKSVCSGGYREKDLDFSKIRSIRSMGKQPTYDIQVGDGNNSFVANDIILHNTAGSRSGGNADAARGQSASMLCFDESDLLSAGDIDSALAIITNFPDATVWMSSTPTGRRERFFDVCFSRNFREFHYPSQVNPNWTEELETLYREQLTEDGYRHEIAADFGEQEEGVYQFKYIQAAQEEYMYGDFRPDSRWIYTIGVDWNDIKIGTTIAVTGYNPVDKKFYLVHKEIVSRADRTQLSACQKVADLNRIWRPQHIYVDAGYGTVQVEVLHDYGNRALVKYGPKHPDATLRDRVKAYDFGGTIEVRDLFTKQIIKKPAKPFLVENSVRRFENYEFRFPKTDERFTAQLSGYIVDRITASGRPTYKQQNEKVGGDHMIDAVNLALVAFTLEKTKWGKPQYDYHIAFSDGMAGSKQTGREAIHQPQQIAGSRTQELVREKSIFAKEENILPVSNTSQPKNDKIWSWPGFGHDAPRPQQKQIKYSRLTPRTRSRPARKKW